MPVTPDSPVILQVAEADMVLLMVEEGEACWYGGGGGGSMLERGWGRAVDGKTQFL